MAEHYMVPPSYHITCEDLLLSFNLYSNTKYIIPKLWRICLLN